MYQHGYPERFEVFITGCEFTEVTDCVGYQQIIVFKAHNCCQHHTQKCLFSKVPLMFTLLDMVMLTYEGTSWTFVSQMVLNNNVVTHTVPYCLYHNHLHAVLNRSAACKCIKFHLIDTIHFNCYFGKNITMLQLIRPKT